MELIKNDGVRQITKGQKMNKDTKLGKNETRFKLEIAQVVNSFVVLHIPSGGGDSTFLGTGTAGISSKASFFGTSGTWKILVSFTDR